MAKVTRKNTKTLVFDPFADMDREMVQDVLGNRTSQLPEALALDALLESLGSIENPEPVESVQQFTTIQAVDPVPEFLDLATAENNNVGFDDFPPNLADFEVELMEETAPLLELMISNLEDSEPEDVLTAFLAEESEAEQVESLALVDRELSDDLFKLVLQDDLDLEETPEITVGFDEAELGTLLVAPTSPVEEKPDFLEEIVRQIDAEVYEADHSGDVFGLTQMASPDAATLKRHVVFSVGSTEYAVPILTVSEVVRPLKITPVPNVPDWALGVANLRGDIISVVDLRVFFGQAAPESLPSNRMLVVHAQNDEVTTGLIVDRASGIFDLPQEQIRSPSAPIDDKVSPFMQGVSEVNDRLLVVLDLNQLLLSPEMQQFH